MSQSTSSEQPLAGANPLERLLGTWVGPESLGEQATTGRFVYRWALGGHFLESDYQQRDVSGQLIFQGRGFYRPSLAAGRYQMCWLDSQPSSIVAQGEWLGDQWVYRNGPIRYIHRCDGINYHFRIEREVDGCIFLSGEYRRVQDS